MSEPVEDSAHEEFLESLDGPTALVYGKFQGVSCKIICAMKLLQSEGEIVLQPIAILGFALAEALAIIGIALAFVLK